MPGGAQAYVGRRLVGIFYKYGSEPPGKGTFPLKINVTFPRPKNCLGYADHSAAHPADVSRNLDRGTNMKSKPKFLPALALVSAAMFGAVGGASAG
jgi:hypothetical protein